ncbi:MAG: damage-control phosphatase ARMT1 family protein [Candidatus Helarchaeota archaeon]
MKVNLDCIPCFQRQALQAVRFVSDDERVQERVLRKVLKVLQNIAWDQTPPEIARVVHRIVREETGVKDPYSEVKRKYNNVALKMYSSLQKIIEEAADPIFTGVKLAIAGNIIDFGAQTSFNLETTIQKVLETPLTINHYPQMVKTLSSAQNLTYLGDNTGEIVFDRLLLETIIKRYEIEQIQFAVKGAPIINDATIEDAKYVGLDKIPGLNFITIGIGVPGTGYERRDKEFLKILNESDIIISKGQGNYEALSDVKGIFFLLLAKCPVIARDLGVAVGDIILKGNFQ